VEWFAHFSANISRRAHEVSGVTMAISSQKKHENEKVKQ
jgi:hypothetical protein